MVNYQVKPHANKQGIALLKVAEFNVLLLILDLVCLVGLLPFCHWFIDAFGQMGDTVAVRNSQYLRLFFPA